MDLPLSSDTAGGRGDSPFPAFDVSTATVKQPPTKQMVKARGFSHLQYCRVEIDSVNMRWLCGSCVRLILVVVHIVVGYERTATLTRKE